MAAGTRTNGRPARPGRKYTRGDWQDFVRTGPGTLAGRYLRTFWHPVCRSEELEPGRTRPIRIMGEDFTLYRAQSGAPHVLAFRCAHRGTQLTAGWVEGDDLRCYYHGWKYSPSGECLEQPGEPEPFCEKIRIRGCPTQEYIGLIFAYFGEGDPPPLPRYAEIEQGEGLLENWYEEWPVNYFNRLENAPDTVHVPFVHYQLGGRENLPRLLEAEETEYGLELTSPGSDRQGIRFHMPNMNYFYSPPKERSLETGPRPAFMWRVPVDDTNHLVFGAQRVQVFGGNVETYLERRREAQRLQQEIPMLEVAQAVLAGKVTTDHIVKTRWWDINSVQDMVTLLGQGPVADREREHLGHEDVGVILLRQLYVRELRALAERRPLKQWTRPGL